MCAVHYCHSFGGDTKESFRTSAPFWRRVATMGLNEALSLQTIKGGVNGPDRHFAAGAELDLLSHRHSIGSIAQPQKRQDNDVLEFTEVIAVRHYLYNIEDIYVCQPS